MADAKRRSRLKYVLFALVAVVLSAGLMVSGLLAADIWLHHKFGQVAGLNIHGYRGPVLGRKRANEQRLVVLGGSTAMGYGVGPDESIPAYLEQRLNEQRQRDGDRRPVRIANLAYNTEGAYAYVYNLRAYERLNYDAVIMYTGFNDMGRVNTYVYRNESPVFRLTGYMPILPLILKEKAMALRYGGDIESAYRGRKTVFRPNAAAQAAASAMEGVVRVGESLDQQLEQVAASQVEAPNPYFPECGRVWGQYCYSVHRAIIHAVSRDKPVLVVAEPFVAKRRLARAQQGQQDALVKMLLRRFGGHREVRYFSAGKIINLANPALCYDDVHLTAEGNRRMAEALVQPVREFLE